jgi:hypothetical protein
MLSGDELMGNLKNDKYKDRTRAGLLGPTWGTANRMADIISALCSNEWNKADQTKAVRMIPYANSSWTYWMSKSASDALATHFNLPQTRSQARAIKGASQ